MNKTENILKEKIDRLSNSQFSQSECFDFFGNLNQSEIKVLLEKIRKQELKIPNPEIEIFLINYLERLNQKIIEKQENKKDES